MANVLAELFQNTAAAIREKTGETGTMKPAEFPEKIRSIQTGGTGGEADVRPLIVTENGIYYPTENVEVGKTYTFKENYTQEELQTLYNASLAIDEENQEAVLFVNFDGDTGLFAAQADGIYNIVFVNAGVYHVYFPENLITIMGFDKAGWYVADMETESYILVDKNMTIAFNDDFQLAVNDISDLNPLFVLEEYDGFSVVGVNVSGAGSGDSAELPQLYAPSIARNGETITMTGSSSNGVFAKKYKIYDNGILIAEQYSTTHSLSDLTFGTHIFEVSSAGEKFMDSEKSNAINASKYSITLHLTDVSTTFSKTYALHGDSIEITFSLPSAYYTMPDTVTATMGGSTEGIVYSRDDRKISVKSVTGDIDIAVTSKEVKLLNDLSWDTIAEYAADGRLAEQFKIGDTKNITIHTNDTTTYTIPFAIAAFGYDDLADGSGKANVTFIATRGFRTGILFGFMQGRSWDRTEQRTQFQSGGIVYDNLPQVLKDNMKTVTKKQGNSGYVGNKELGTTTDQMFWLSLTEVGLTDEECFAIEGEPYPIFTDNASRKRMRIGTTRYEKYALRDKKDKAGGHDFAGVAADGSLGLWYTGDDAINYINIIGFCL